MSTFADLFGDTDSSDDGEENHQPAGRQRSFDKDEFEREWLKAEQEFEQEWQRKERQEEEAWQAWREQLAAEEREQEIAIQRWRLRTDRRKSRTPSQLQALQIDKRPCSALSYYSSQPAHHKHYNGSLLHYGWTPVLRTILQGTRSVKRANTNGHSDGASASSNWACPLALLRGYEESVVRHIFSYLPNPYAQHVRMTIPADLIGNGDGWGLMRFGSARGSFHADNLQRLLTTATPTNNPMDGFVAFAKVGQVLELFPKPTGRNVNMMPFLLGNRESLPDDLQCYHPLIESCLYERETDLGTVAYLTVHESIRVEAGKTQRRPGLHIESPGVFADDDVSRDNKDSNASSPLTATGGCSFTPGVQHYWGRGACNTPDVYKGGMYIASTVNQSTAVWDALVDSSIPGIVDRHGACTPLRKLLPGSDAAQLEAGELIWMTDCTPHAALPQPRAGPRTFFRLVLSPVTHWYAAHSTPNPKVAIPDTVIVVEDCKFAAVSTKQNPMVFAATSVATKTDSSK